MSQFSKSNVFIFISLVLYFPLLDHRMSPLFKILILFFHLKIILLKYLKFKKKLTEFLKVTFHLQLLQNIDCIPHIVQYILEPLLHPRVCTSHSSIPTLISLHPPQTLAPCQLVTTNLFSVYVSLFILCYTN